MIQINLIPDIKREYLRARKMRDLTVSMSIVISIAAAALVGIMILLLGAQVVRETLADNAIKTEYEKLASVESLSEMVTIQNQLSLISSQHETATRDSRIFTVLQVINPQRPNNVTFSSVIHDPTTRTLVLEGSASAGYPALEELLKTIRSVNITYDDANVEEGNTSVPFAEQVMTGESSYGVDSDNQRTLRFSINVTYKEGVFTNTIKDDSIRIVGPTREINVTDSRVRVPDSLFAAPARDLDEEGN